MNRGMLMDKVLPEVVQHCLNAETAEPEALAGCGCRAEPPEEETMMASTYMQARWRSAEGGPRARHCDSGTAHQRGRCGAAAAASHGDMLATSWHVGEPRETSRILGTGDAPKSLAWINSASCRYAAWKSAWLGSGLGLGLAPSPGGGSSGQVVALAQAPAPRATL